MILSATPFTASPTRPTADWMPDTIPSMMSEPHFRASAGRDVIQSMAAWMPVTMASRTLPIVVLMPSSRLPAASRILSQFFHSKTPIAIAAAIARMTGPKALARTEITAPTTLITVMMLFTTTKASLITEMTAFTTEITVVITPKIAEMPLTAAMTATTPTAILPMDSPMSVHFFLSTFPLDNSLKN